MDVSIIRIFSRLKIIAVKWIDENSSTNEKPRDRILNEGFYFHSMTRSRKMIIHGADNYRARKLKLTICSEDWLKSNSIYRIRCQLTFRISKCKRIMK